MVVDRINTFVKTYDISFEELLIQDPKGYKYVALKLRSFLLIDSSLIGRSTSSSIVNSNLPLDHPRLQQTQVLFAAQLIADW